MRNLLHAVRWLLLLPLLLAAGFAHGARGVQVFSAQTNYQVDVLDVYKRQGLRASLEGGAESIWRK